jgi:hypothetical protein
MRYKNDGFFMEKALDALSEYVLANFLIHRAMIIKEITFSIFQFVTLKKWLKR